MWLLYFVCYLFFFRYDSMDQFSTHSCVSRNHRQPSETSVPYYTYSPATDRLFWRHVKKKNVPWHILAPRAVACDSLHLRASAHLWHVNAFFCNREFLGISCYKKMAEHTIFMYSAIIAVLILLDSLTDQISHLSGSNLLFALVHDIDGAVALCEDLSDRILDSICFLVKVEGEAEHHSCGEDRRDRICDVFSCDIRCGTMARLVETKFALI